MLSCQQTQNVIDGKKRIILNPGEGQRKDFETVSYQLKMKTSRAVFTEVQKKAGPFPFNVRVLEDEKRARMGLQEAVQHSLVKPYEVVCAFLPVCNLEVR